MALRQTADTEQRSMSRILNFSGVAVALGLAAAVLASIYQPAHAERRDIQARITAAENFLADQSRIEDESQLLNEHMARSELVLDEAMSRIPATPQVSEFLADLSQLASRSSLTIREFRPGTPVNREKFQELEINITAEGLYPGLCRFLDGLQTMPRLCHVRSLNVMSVSDGSDNHYPISMTVVIYSAPLSELNPEEGEPGNG